MSLFVSIYVLLHGHPMPPLPRVLERVACEKYVEGVNDCSNKAGRYAKACNAAGIPATVVYVRCFGSRHLNAIVQVAGLFVDCTTGDVKRTLAEFGEKVTAVTLLQLARDEELA